MNRKLIHKVRHLLDSQSARNGGPWRPLRSASAAATRPLQGPVGSNENITTHTGARQFESFLKHISRSDSLLDARRLRNDIVAELRRTRELLGMRG
jgi:sorting nexin-25